VALLSKFFGRAASEGAAFALGTATGPVLAPAVQELINEAWRTHPSRTVDAAGAAQIVAEDVERADWGASEAAAHGVDGDRFKAIVGAVLNAPGVPELLELHRRGAIGDDELAHGFRKAKLELEWDRPLRVLLDVLLAPAELANARQQGYIDQGRQHDEAALQGIDADRAEIQYQMVGLPPGVAEALQMLRRGIIDEPTFAQIVREGHTKTKYTDQLLELRNVVLSPSTYATLHLKGWITEQQMIAGGALSGESAENMRQMYLSMGRPAAPGQLWTAWARKVDGPAGRPMDEAQFTKAIAESDIRPEYAPMLWGIRYAYPPLFQITRLVTAGTITVADAVDWAEKDRYAPEVIAALRTAWESGGATTAKGLTVTDLTAEYEGLTMTRTQYVNGLKELGYSQDAAEGKVSVSDSKRRRNARNQLINRARVRYTTWKVPRQAAQDALRAAELTIGLSNELLASWDAERDLNVHELTEAQVVKAYKKAIMDRPTATERLTELGLKDTDVATRLDE
jgi:hypothetical protein